MIIRSQEGVDKFIEQVTGKDVFIVPVFCDIHKHPAINKLSLLYVYLISDDKEYIMVFNHHENNDLTCHTVDLNVLNKKVNSVYTHDKKTLLHAGKCFEKAYDLDLFSYMIDHKNVEIEFETTAHRWFQTKYWNLADLNCIIPIIKHLEYCTRIKNYYLSYVYTKKDEAYLKFNDILTEFYQIEANGIYIDKNLLQQYFPKKQQQENNFVFSEYNLNTSTGRPSNRFGGINFAALKKDGERTIIKSRFGDEGMLVEFDYDAFHVRLIGDIIDYQFPKNINVHEYLGKYYFGKDILTPKEYEKSKLLTFKTLYSGFFTEYKSIPFFKIVNEYIYYIWQSFSLEGYVSSLINDRKIKKEFFDTVNKNKLWNYYLQLTETEYNSEMIKSVNKLDYKSKFILYTYDSFLFDVYIPEAKEFIMKVKFLLEDKFPVKLKYGKDYHNMKPLEIENV